jgi:hypothetical protein
MQLAGRHRYFAAVFSVLPQAEPDFGSHWIPEGRLRGQAKRLSACLYQGCCKVRIRGGSGAFGPENFSIWGKLAAPGTLWVPGLVMLAGGFSLPA